ncbi:hypothetical protein [Algoriphagus machipongonensis]|uniref:Uncharacterized protein n=1 Tax=Algoriphagus machipongonensis TaxID=388413 RepID=A3HT91_9BACT|nr:hypothetical protein [Algoriphagus machipongonensis]EAZ83059.1 hypothetical protein ALPR1_12600 [Algoriphagus machipongonensis]
MEQNQISTKRIIYDLLEMKGRAIKLLENDYVFNDFLKEFLKSSIAEEFENQIPSIKEISKRFNIKYDKLRKYLHLIYQELIGEGVAKIPFEFKNITYVFNIYYDLKKQNLSFESRCLPVIPRVGESISISFFYAYFGYSHFYVEEITHEFLEDQQIVRIQLRPGYFNSYWRFRKDQAEEEGELAFDDLYNLNEYQLKVKLGIGRYKHWAK